MAKKRSKADPALAEVYRICRKIKTTCVYRWRLPTIEHSLGKLRTMQGDRGGGFFGVDFNPEINFLVAAIALKKAK